MCLSASRTTKTPACVPRRGVQGRCYGHTSAKKKEMTIKSRTAKHTIEPSSGVILERQAIPPSRLLIFLGVAAGAVMLPGKTRQEAHDPEIRVAPLPVFRCLPHSGTSARTKLIKPCQERGPVLSTTAQWAALTVEPGFVVRTAIERASIRILSLGSSQVWVARLFPPERVCPP
jgi:hypothetical protein